MWKELTKILIGKCNLIVYGDPVWIVKKTKHYTPGAKLNRQWFIDVSGSLRDFSTLII